MNMNSSIVLLNLLRIALGNSVEWKGEGSVDWKEVIGLVRKQGVLAIAFDALEWVPAELRPAKNILLEWFARETGVQISYDDEHHSIFTFGKCTVENHATVLNVWPRKSNIWINDLLEKLAKECIDGADCGLVLPSVRFNSIHLLRHMATDFATEKTTLRHVLDWATFVKCHSDEIDWGFVRETAYRVNMHLFLDALNSICVVYLGYPKYMFPVEKQDVKLRDRVLEDILNPKFQAKTPPMEDRIAYGMMKTRRLWANRWKHRLVFNETLLASFWNSAVYRLMH